MPWPSAVMVRLVGAPQSTAVYTRFVPARRHTERPNDIIETR